MLEPGTKAYSAPTSKPRGRPLDTVTLAKGTLETLSLVASFQACLWLTWVSAKFRPTSKPTMPSDEAPCICLKLVTAPKSVDKPLKSDWLRPGMVMSSVAKAELLTASSRLARRMRRMFITPGEQLLRGGS